MRIVLATLLMSAALSAGLSAQTPVAQAPAADARTVAQNLAARLEANFVYPDRGKLYADTLRAKAAAGAYDALSGAALAMKLTEDLQAVNPDGHLRVMFEGAGGPAMLGAGPMPGPGAAPGRMPMRRPPITPIEHAGWIAPGIAYVRFNLFPGDPAIVAAARAFMADHASAKTIIFDVRTHRGGGTDEMDAIFPWLYAKPTPLVAMATRKSVFDAGLSPLQEGATLHRVQADPAFVTLEHWAQPGRDQRLAKAKVYLLTSPRTASAAEHFALALKATGRATLIGGTTAGANHFGGMEDVGGGFVAFVPVGRTYDPRTGKDWEGAGVAPDIETKPEDALVKALTLADVAPETAATLSAKVAPTEPMVRRR